jgi:hypothetical protein
MIDVTRFCKTDDWVNEDIGVSLTGRSDSEFSVSTVHRVTSLEGDDFSPCEFLEVRTQLRGCVLVTFRLDRSQVSEKQRDEHRRAV